MKDRNVLFRNLALGVFAAIMIFTALPAFAQDDAADEFVKLDRKLVPEAAGKLIDFVPKGWKIEEEITGDVNADKIADHLLKLIEDKPATGTDDAKTDRSRGLVIVLEDKDGKLTRAAVASNLLQCATCGGAFYGVIDAPAEVTIEKGVIVIGHEHGSSSVTTTTMRFRHDAASKTFLLIGYKYVGVDRLDGSIRIEDTNYSTGARTISFSKGKKDVTRKTRAAKMKLSIENADYSKLEEEASARVEKL